MFFIGMDRKVNPFNFIFYCTLYVTDRKWNENQIKLLFHLLNLKIYDCFCVNYNLEETLMMRFLGNVLQAPGMFWFLKVFSENRGNGSDRLYTHITIKTVSIIMEWYHYL